MPRPRRWRVASRDTTMCSAASVSKTTWATPSVAGAGERPRKKIVEMKGAGVRPTCEVERIE